MKSIVLLLVATIFLNSCGLVFSGIKQKVKVNDGFPTQADVYYNGSYQGQTPINVKIPKKALKDGGAVLTIKKDGYESSEITFDRRIRVGALILDIFTGGIWLIADFLTGGIYKGSPKKVDYKLQESNK
ncbi:MAG: PEGA domain-containing protein [Crocinitomicaceae bacterium]|nr:PEGA domain-containing protein [Crocinitomicaceae bacterium]